MNIVNRLVLFLVLLFSVGTAYAARGAIPMKIPEPVVVPAALTQENADKALRAALIGRGWTISDEKAGGLDATLLVRQHTLKMRFTETGGKIAMSYVDSAVLEYEVRSGVPYIHPNVMKWLNLLVMDINANLVRV